MALPPPSPDATCLVTGASSGIGVEIARQLAGRGLGVTLVARREDRLRELATELAAVGVRAEAIGCDVSDHDSRHRLAAELEERGLTVDVLVNNAGFSTSGPFVDSDPEREVALVRTNVEAVVELCALFAPGMVARGRGGVLNVASTVAFQPMPMQSSYAASKAFVLSFTDSLHAELRGTGVSVTALCPGPVKTEFTEVANLTSADDQLPAFLWDSPDTVAKAGVDGLEKGKRVVIPGALNRGGAVLGHHTPRSLFLRIASRVHPAARP
jgi:short-subunit dehydrogenase